MGGLGGLGTRGRGVQWVTTGDAGGTGTTGDVEGTGDVGTWRDWGHGDMGGR